MLWRIFPKAWIAPPIWKQRAQLWRDGKRKFACTLAPSRRRLLRVWETAMRVAFLITMVLALSGAIAYAQDTAPPAPPAETAPAPALTPQQLKWQACMRGDAAVA